MCGIEDDFPGLAPSFLSNWQPEDYRAADEAVEYYQKHGRTYHRLAMREVGHELDDRHPSREGRQPDDMRGPTMAGGGGQAVPVWTNATKPETPAATPTSDVGKQPPTAHPGAPWLQRGTQGGLVRGEW